MDCVYSTLYWDDVTKDLCREFGALEFEDSVESLCKLPDKYS